MDGFNYQDNNFSFKALRIWNLFRSVFLLVFFLSVGFCASGCINKSNKNTIYFSDSLEYNKDLLSKRNYFGIRPVEILNQNLLKYEIDYCSNHEIDSLLRIPLDL
jgi:hypothetical protein